MRNLHQMVRIGKPEGNSLWETVQAALSSPPFPPSPGWESMRGTVSGDQSGLSASPCSPPHPALPTPLTWMGVPSPLTGTSSGRREAPKRHAPPPSPLPPLSPPSPGWESPRGTSGDRREAPKQHELPRCVDS